MKRLVSGIVASAFFALAIPAVHAEDKKPAKDGKKGEDGAPDDGQPKTDAKKKKKKDSGW